jgi:hypothetical protein
MKLQVAGIMDSPGHRLSEEGSVLDAAFDARNQQHWHLMEVFRQVGRGIHDPLAFRWNRRGIVLGLRLPVEVSDAALAFGIGDDDEVPTLGVAASGRL